MDAHFYLDSPTISQLVDLLRYRGCLTDSRLGDTLEVSPVLVSWPLGVRPSRSGLSPLLADVEASMVLTGSWRPDALQRWCPNVPLDAFEDWARYGPLVGRQLDRAVRTLQKDPASRRAVVALTGRTSTPPCNCLVHFLTRRGELSVHVYIRSSDLLLGLPYDVGTWSVVGSVVAATLGLARGRLHLYLASLHHYLTAPFPSGSSLLRLGEVPPLPDARVLAARFLDGGDRWLAWSREEASQ